MTDRPFDADDERTEYDDVPGPVGLRPRHRRPGLRVGGRRRAPRGRGGRGDGPRFAGPASAAAGPGSSSASPVVLLLVGGVVGVWVQRQIDPSGLAGRAADRWSSPRARARRRSATSWRRTTSSSSSFVWDWYLRINGGGPFEAGEYQLASRQLDGRRRRRRSRVGPRPTTGGASRSPRASRSSRSSPGWPTPRRASASRLTKLQAALASGQVRSTYQPAGQTSSEGILFPDTYEFDPKKTTELAVLQQMVGQIDVHPAASSTSPSARDHAATCRPTRSSPSPR